MGTRMHVRQSFERLTSSEMAYPEVGPITVWPVQNRVGECPVWSPKEQALYWIDVRAPQLLRLVPDTGELTRWHLPEVVGAIALADNAEVWLAFPHRLVSLRLASGELTKVTDVETDRPNNRLNDGKVSPSGCWFVFGSMDDRPTKTASGALYRTSASGEVHRLMDGLTVANGIAWSVDGRQLYFSDSHVGQVYVASWEEATGTMGERRLLVSLDEAAGRPDGAAVDMGNCYWSAGVSAGVLHRIDASGNVLQRLGLPCRAPTMCSFGGADLQTVFVTSLVRAQWTIPGLLDGALLSFRHPVAGTAMPQLITGPNGGP